MIGKIIIGVLSYIILVVITCIFFKGATQLGNEYDEKMENEMLYLKLFGKKN